MYTHICASLIVVVAWLKFGAESYAYIIQYSAFHNLKKYPTASASGYVGSTETKLVEIQGLCSHRCTEWVRL